MTCHPRGYTAVNDLGALAVLTREFMIKVNHLIPGLFRSEYRKLVSVLCSLFGIQHMEEAEDIVSDTFLSATEIWPVKGIPDNPKAWLYKVAKNKTRNYLKRAGVFERKVSSDLQYICRQDQEEISVDLTEKNINDSQLAMIFVICNPCNPDEAQVSLALSVLCGFSINEIADAYLTNREVVYKRINRAKARLKERNLKIRFPKGPEIKGRLDSVLKIIYLLFSEGYYSTSENRTLRKDLCFEAMRLNHLLIENESTNLPSVNALMALMCFHSSRFDTRLDTKGDLILYEDQNESLWNWELIERGAVYLSKSASGTDISQYHLEAGIAFWQTQKTDSPEKWQNLLDLYDSRLLLDYSPIAALSRVYVLSKVKGKVNGILAAQDLNLINLHFYHALLGELYTDIDNEKAMVHFYEALSLTATTTERKMVENRILNLQNKN